MLCALVCLKKKHNAAGQYGSPRQQYIGAISAIVDSIDSHIILRIIKENKPETWFELNEVRHILDNYSRNSCGEVCR